jgi:hypothetical protein
MHLHFVSDIAMSVATQQFLFTSKIADKIKDR